MIKNANLPIDGFLTVFVHIIKSLQSTKLLLLYFQYYTINNIKMECYTRKLFSYPHLDIINCIFTIQTGRVLAFGLWSIYSFIDMVNLFQDEKYEKNIN